MANKTNTNETLYPVFIPKRFKGDDIRSVSVNGRYKQIPTGKQFFVEKCFAEVIENAELADQAAEKFKKETAKD